MLIRSQNKEILVNFNVSAGIEILRGYAEILQKAVVFQMPEDGSAEI